MDFDEMRQRALDVRRRYAELERRRYGREWTPEEIALGFVGDVGDLAKLVQGKAGVRPREDLDEAVGHELADCLWSVIVLADRYGVDLERAFESTMDGLGEWLADQTGPTVEVRPAVADDCPAILDVMFSTAMSRESTWWKNTVPGLERKLSEGGGFVAEDQGDVVGCVMHVVEGDRMGLRGLAVRPSHEGRGIGTRLVRAVEEEAARAGLDEVLLAVSASNLEVCDYYTRLGYDVSSEPYAHAVPGRPAPRVFVKQLGPR